MNTLSILFFLTAILYSSVGFGGGSTYLAILLIWGVPYTIFPIIPFSLAWLHFLDLFIFFKETGTNIPNKPATIIFKIIEIPISKERFNSLNHN